ncbi:MAG: AAA family ATPase [Paludibacteraceae bacterium]|nr:AAA family ATPase [Paludibacteraceae bacterium]
MSAYQITLRNIKNIQELVFPFPQNKGVYVLTGSNGSGKTSLLTALSRLGNRNAFSHYKSNQLIDKYPNASVEYTTPTDSVTYVHGEQRWVPSPKRNNVILSQFPFHNTRFVSTAGTRFFTQEQLGGNHVRFTSATNYIKDAMNMIMGTTKFNNLQYITIGVIRGRQRNPHRDNKLYVIRTLQTYYSEQNFSLGERLLLNTLEELETVPGNTLLLIDEVELSLHPIAQVKFYDFLEKEAKEKHLCIILSTHSSTLIKHAQNRIYLENNDGIVKTITDCYPSYILRTISSADDRIHDFLFIVEDDMAKDYLEIILKRYMENMRHVLSYTVLPIGGWQEVVKFEENIATLGYSKTKTQVFLDADVQDTLEFIRQKGDQKSQADLDVESLFQRNANNICYLDITPEVGMWSWLKDNGAILQNHFDNTFGNQNYSIQELTQHISRENAGKLPTPETAPEVAGVKLRKWGKACFKDFKNEITANNPQIDERDIYKTMISCYVENNFNIDCLRETLEPLFNRG